MGSNTFLFSSFPCSLVHSTRYWTCQELAGQTVSLKEIQKARAERRKQVKEGLSSRQALVEQFLAVHQQEAPKPETQAKEPAETTGRPRLKRYINE